MKKTVLATSLLLPFFATQVLANDGNAGYGGITYSSIEDDGDVELSSLGARIGAFANENFSLEARLQTGVEDHEEYSDFLGGNLTVEVEQIYGVYGRLGAYLTPNLYPYAIVGYSKLDYEVTFSSGGFSATDDDSESSFSFGFGIDLWMNESVSLNVEFMRLIDENDFEIEALTGGLMFKF